MSLRLSSSTIEKLQIILEADDKDLYLKMKILQEMAANGGDHPVLKAVSKVLLQKMENFDIIDKTAWKDICDKLEPTIRKYYQQTKAEIDRQYFYGERR